MDSLLANKGPRLRDWWGHTRLKVTPSPFLVPPTSAMAPCWIKPLDACPAEIGWLEHKHPLVWAWLRQRTVEGVCRKLAWMLCCLSQAATSPAVNNAYRIMQRGACLHALPWLCLCRTEKRYFQLCPEHAWKSLLPHLSRTVQHRCDLWKHSRECRSAPHWTKENPRVCVTHWGFLAQQLTGWPLENTWDSQAFPWADVTPGYHEISRGGLSTSLDSEDRSPWGEYTPQP